MSYKNTKSEKSKIGYRIASDGCSVIEKKQLFM